MSNQALQLLLIEDNAADIALVQEALSDPDFGMPITLLLAHDTTEADLVLSSTAVDLILLDNSLPGRQGIEWLEQFKSSHALSRIPVVMFTASEAPETVQAAYQHHISAYLVKPLKLEDLRQMLHAMLVYWGTIARLPPHNS